MGSDKERTKAMKASEFDTKFDAGEDISMDIDRTQAKRPNETPERVALDLPLPMLNALDHEAERLGIARQDLIKIWIAERLEQSNRS